MRDFMLLIVATPLRGFSEKVDLWNDHEHLAVKDVDQHLSGSPVGLFLLIVCFTIPTVCISGINSKIN